MDQINCLLNSKSRFKAVELSPRLLPMQVLGKQATSTAFKAKSTLRMLSLEAEVDVARCRVRSLLSDMGVESGLWVLPELPGLTPSIAGGDAGAGNQRCFPLAAPVADFDHLLHHVMCEGEFACSANANDLWLRFDGQVSGLAKVFSKRDHCELYLRNNVLNNTKVPREAKKALVSMFASTCPSYHKSRWHFAFDVLHWISKREALIQWLEPTTVSDYSAQDARPEDMSKSEGEFLRKLAQDPVERSVFWGFFWMYYLLQGWGFGVYRWLHACPCHDGDKEGPAAASGKSKRQESCKFAGRRLIELASGKCHQFAAQLDRLALESSPKAVEALRKLQDVDSESAGKIRNCFEIAKRKILLRFQQGTSYYTTFPWNVVSLLRYVLTPAGGARCKAVRQSRTFAEELCQKHDAGQLPTGHFADMFFAGDMLLALRSWSAMTGPNDAMDESLFAELLSYGLALVCMQRLEGRHHLVSLKMGASRASSASTVSAALRRRLNQDVLQPSFRDGFESHLQVTRLKRFRVV